jgi:hypothetical protein
MRLDPICVLLGDMITLRDFALDLNVAEKALDLLVVKIG